MSGTLSARIEAANARILGDGDLDAIDEVFAPGHVTHLTERDMPGGPAEVLKFVTRLRRAFPDLKVEVEILAVHDDRVAWQRTLRGTHRRDFMGFPATGRPIVWRDMLTSRFEDGRIAEEWAVSDLAERLLLARKRRGPASDATA